MRYEIGDKKSVYAVIDDKGVHITWATGFKESRFIPFDKLVSVSVKKPGLLSAGLLFFQTATDGNNPYYSKNSVPFRGNDNYELACKIQAEVEAVLCS